MMNNKLDELYVITVPHRRDADLDVYRDREDLISDVMEHNDYWSRDEYATAEEWKEHWKDVGEGTDPMPHPACGFPCIEIICGSNLEPEYYAPDDAPSEYELALEVLGHDMHTILVIETEEDLQNALKYDGHQWARVQTIAESLVNGDDDNEDEEDA